MKSPRQQATFGGGCFWCTEAVFRFVEGVTAVTSGYAGGHAESPDYEQVGAGTTGHAEVIQIEFDPAKVSYEELLLVFWHAHDPTTQDRQGPDVGTQYRSIILHHDEEQRALAAASIQRMGSHFTRPIVTELAPLQRFFPAEQYHQDYFRRQPNAPYCQIMVRPKLEKIRAALARP